MTTEETDLGLSAFQSCTPCKLEYKDNAKPLPDWVVLICIST